MRRHDLRFTHALAMASGIGAASCGPTGVFPDEGVDVVTADNPSTDRALPPDVPRPTDTGVDAAPDVIRADVSLDVSVGDMMVADAGPDVTTLDARRRT